MIEVCNFKEKMNSSDTCICRLTTLDKHNSPMECSGEMNCILFKLYYDSEEL